MKSKNYYANARPEILRWVEKQSDAVILDIGCGTGATLALLKGRGYCGVTVGVEMCPQCEDDARAAVDEFHAKRFEAWDSTDSGILDRTHRRFFTRRSARALFDRCGFAVLREDCHYDPGVSGAILRAFPITREFAACQLLFVLSVGKAGPSATSSA